MDILFLLFDFFSCEYLLLIFLDCEYIFRLRYFDEYRSRLEMFLGDDGMLLEKYGFWEFLLKLYFLIFDFKSEILVLWFFFSRFLFVVIKEVGGKLLYIFNFIVDYYFNLN